MKFFALLALAALPLAPVHAQTSPPTPRHATVVDLTGAAGPTLNYGSAAAWRLWGLDAGGRFQAGVGVRASHFFADGYALDQQTGAASGISQVPRPNLTALNAAFHLRARVAGPLRLGFNLDVAGLTLGPDRTLDLTSGPPAPRPVRRGTPSMATCCGAGAPTSARSTRSCTPPVAVARGLEPARGLQSPIVTSYATEADRYHRFRNLAALGLSYQLP